MLGAWIQDERNRSGVVGQETNEDALTSMAVPFRDLLAILESCVKDINGAAKDMGTWETGA